MVKNTHSNKGFTLIELLIMIAVIAILAVIGAVVYQGLQQRAATAAVFKDLKGSSEQLDLSYVQSPDNFRSLDRLSENIQSSQDVVVRLVAGYTGNTYENLSPVQQGVLFYEVCEQLIADPMYSTIHSKDGNDTSSVVMKCTDNIRAGGILITGWQSKTWDTPLTRETLEAYIASVPYDDWWIDRQDVVRGFYNELIQRYQAMGGSFPITSFWDPWANQWSGVPKEELPSPSPSPAVRSGSFCVEAYHTAFPDSIYKITQDDTIEAGTC